MRAFWANLWRRRWFRWTFTPVASLVLTWCCICLILNYVGEKRWQKVKARLAAEGESLDYFAMLLPPIPDEQNFCAIEPLMGIQAFEERSEAFELAKNKQKAIADQSTFIAWYDRGNLVFDPLGRGEHPDDQAILEGLGKTGVFEHGAKIPLKTWQELRTAAEAHAPILTELSKAAVQRVLAEYLPRLPRRDTPQKWMSLDHLYVCQDLGTLCCLYSLICLRCDDVQASVDASLILLRLGQAAVSSCTPFGCSMGATHRSAFFSLVWLLLEGRHLNDAGLARMQKELKRVDVVGDYLQCSRAQVAFDADYYDYLRDHPLERGKLTSYLVSLDEDRYRAILTVTGVGTPGGFFSLNKAQDIRIQYDHIIQPLKKSGLRHLKAEDDKLQMLLDSSSGWQHPDLILVKAKLGSSENYTLVLQQENQRLQALLACALERHFLRHQAYPSTLEDLDSDLLLGVSLHDVIGDKFLYKLVPEGRFRLWSSGTDGVNDGGIFTSEIPGDNRSLVYLSGRGDWVWRYEPGPEGY